jgi:hypothetical protein
MSIHTAESVLQKKKNQGEKLWSYILWSAEYQKGRKLSIRDLLELAYLIEEGIQSTLSTGLLLVPIATTDDSKEFEPIINFYHSPELHRKQVSYTTLWLSHQLHTGTVNFIQNEQKLIQSIHHIITPTPKSYWINHTSVTTL